MKYLIFSALYLIPFLTLSNTNKGYFIQVKSTEIQTVTGSFEIEIDVLQRLDKINIDSIWIHDDYFTLTCNSTNEFVKAENDTLVQNNCPFTLNYDDNSLPFHAKDVDIYFKVILNDSIMTIEKRRVKIYFTPYNTIEIWNQSDLGLLPRSWNRPDTIRNIIPPRIFVHPDSIPESDIDFTLFEQGDDTLDIEFMQVDVPGLAYRVLMNDTTTSYSDNYGDGPDSLDISKSLCPTFSGSVTVRLVYSLINDCGQPITIPLRNIKVQLRENDAIGSQLFDTKYTDNDGYITFNYSESQCFEGSGLELFFKVFSTSNQQVNAVNYLWVTKREDTKDNYLFAPDGFIGNYNIDVSFFDKPEAYLAVHRGVKSKSVFASEGLPLYNYLRLLTERNNSFNCWPGMGIPCEFLASFTSFGIPGFVTVPTIFLAEGDVEGENVFNHEFGHFVEFTLQNNRKKLPCSQNFFNHSPAIDESPVMAWSEGFADFVCRLLDLKLQNEDGESGQGYIVAKYIQSQSKHVEYGHELVYRFGLNSNLTNGLRTEHYIGSALFDLYDGSNMNPQWCNSNSVTNDRFGLDVDDDIHKDFRSIDDVSLSLQKICEPLTNQTGAFNLGLDNVGEYLEDLTSGMNMDDKADVLRIFRENYVV